MTYHITTFGCQMNARDSEKLAGVLESMGYTPTDSEDADLVVINTCSVRENADNRALGHLGELKGYKKHNPLMKIVLCGCMMQEAGMAERIAHQYPFVDLIFGTFNISQFPELLEQMYAEDATVTAVSQKPVALEDGLASRRRYSFKSGVNISYGCDNFCSYCIVPYVRGRERSRMPADILDEVQSLARDGVKEVMLLGQNVNSYGKGLPCDIDFSDLLQEVEAIDGIQRIRFMTSHPKDLSEKLIEMIRDSRKICRHLHLPLQSGSTRILHAMNRRYTKEQYISLALHIREEIPDIAITTDIIVGFPCETDEDVDDTIDTVLQVGFDNAFTFMYSPRPGTPAASMEQVPQDVVKRNFDKVLRVVQDTARDRASRYLGQTQDALVEEYQETVGMYEGRLSNNMIVHFPAFGVADLIGQILPVKLTECKGFYYIGEIDA